MKILIALMSFLSIEFISLGQQQQSSDQYQSNSYQDQYGNQGGNSSQNQINSYQQQANPYGNQQYDQLTLQNNSYSGQASTNAPLLPATEPYTTNGLTPPQNPGLSGMQNTSSFGESVTTIPETEETQTYQDEGYTVPLAAVIDTPNEFSGIPVPTQSRKVFADGEAPETYVVESGDTLYDICDQLLNEASYWPKLWALNPFIKNPHFLWPGMRLRFFPGDQDSPPYLEVVTEEDVIPVDKKNINIDELLKSSIAIDSNLYKPAITPIIGPEDLQETENTFFLVGSIYEGGNQVEMTVPGFILDKEPKPLCIVQGGDSGESMTMEDRKFLCLPSEEGRPPPLNQQLTVLRPYLKPEVVDNQNNTQGYLYQFVAHIIIQKELTSEDANKIYYGIVKKSRLGVEPNDIIVEYRSTQRKIALSPAGGRALESAGKIVALQDDGIEFGGQGYMALINKGTSHGVSIGQTFNIHQDLYHLSFARLTTEEFKNTSQIGSMRIIDATAKGAVGYIIQNSQEVRIGDTVGR